LLFIRKPSLDDEAEVKKCYRESRSIHHPWVIEPNNFDAYLSQPERLFLCLDETQEIVGTFNISNIVRGYFQSAYLGYEVFSPHNSKGYMSKGIILAIEHAFKVLNLHRLEANVQPENEYSKKLLLKSGFVKEGYSKNYLNIGGKGWQDHERWAILNHDWRCQNS
jgi:ribosomal-protein-alanine N-acetyltransferase